MDDSTAVAMLAILVIFGGPLAAFVLFRVLRHRERMAQLKHGWPYPTGGSHAWEPPPFAPPPPGFPQYGQQAAAFAARAQFRKGVVLAFIGMALTIGLSSGLQHVGPALLGGLIPLFIGIAQAGLAVLSDPSILQSFSSAVGGRPESNGNVAPPPPYQGGPASEPSPMPPFDGGSYTYRPDGTRELRPPTSPPERRS